MCVELAVIQPVVRASACPCLHLSIMHPEIGWSLACHLLSYWLKGTPVVILDAPLLFESGLHRIARCVVTVTCTRQQQLDRLVSRDGLPLEEAERRMAAQMPAEEKARRSQYVVDNSGRWGISRFTLGIDRACIWRGESIHPWGGEGGADRQLLCATRHAQHKASSG